MTRRPPVVKRNLARFSACRHKNYVPSQVIMTAATLNLKALCLYLGRPRRTIYNMLQDGRFPVQPIPGTKPRLWAKADVDAWMSGAYRAA